MSVFLLFIHPSSSRPKNIEIGSSSLAIVSVSGKHVPPLITLIKQTKKKKKRKEKKTGEKKRGKENEK
jgi:hypothetical protein